MILQLSFFQKIALMPKVVLGKNLKPPSKCIHYKRQEQVAEAAQDGRDGDTEGWGSDGASPTTNAKRPPSTLPCSFCTVKN